MGRRAEEFRTVPNQRIININKSPTDKQHYYTTNNLSALDKASGDLIEKGSFKLYIYLAKNQNDYTFALSSSDFMKWSSLSKSAYTTAFNELVSKGYLVQQENKKNLYKFYDIPHLDADQQEKEELIVNSPEENEFVF